MINCFIIYNLNYFGLFTRMKTGNGAHNINMHKHTERQNII